MIAILHNIRSLHNVGSIFRSADGVGLEKLYLCGITPSPLDRFGKVRPQLKKVSLGAEQSVLWEKVFSTIALIKKLKKEGYNIIAVEQDKRAKSYSNYLLPNYQLPFTALIFGNELVGIPKSILDLADTIIEIPMHGKKESLNVSVTFGIIAYFFRYKLKGTSHV